MTANGAREGRPRIGYWIFNYEPHWEAASKELDTLAGAFASIYGTRMISLNLNGRKTRLAGRDKHLPAPLALSALPLLMRAARSTSVNHIFASAGERILTPRLARLERTILTVTKGCSTLARYERNLTALKSLRRIVVESERHRDLLLQMGVPDRNIELIYPGIASESYRPAAMPFTIMFATSPKDGELLTRGIYLMIRAAERLPDVRFRLVWRKNPEAARNAVREARIENVDILCGHVEDMKPLYDSAHAVILPALENDSLKPCPHSALHALAHGKPVLVSRAVSISCIVARDECGLAFEPSVDALCAAIANLKNNYARYQGNALETLNRRFSKREFVARYAAVYAELLSERSVNESPRSHSSRADARQVRRPATGVPERSFFPSHSKSNTSSSSGRDIPSS